MKDIIININHKGCPKGATRTVTAKRDGYIIKAYRLGMGRKTIAGMMGISYLTVCKAIKRGK